MNRGLFIAAGAVILVASAQADDIKKLSGSLHIRGRSIVDAPAEEANDTHAAFVLDGDSARALFEAMKVEARRDECLDDGSTTKQLGNIRCTRRAPDGRYECDFALDLVHQTIEPGQVC